MDRMAYVAMTGARQTELAQAVTANNIANASTTGFRADLHGFQSIEVEGPGRTTRVNAVGEVFGTDFQPGTVTTTGRDLDVAIAGSGFFAVQSKDGSEAYTRAGDFRVNAVGQLLTAGGEAVLGERGPVAIPPSTSITIGTDGTVSVTPLGQGPEAQAIVDRIKLVNPPVQDLDKGSDGLFRRTDAASSNADANVAVRVGSLESSNVNIADELVNMISLARRYEMQLKAIETTEENADSAAAMLRLRG
ncbi:MAG: flagellar basal-body rod protein FlgF [Pseudomonadota bacterium]